MNETIIFNNQYIDSYSYIIKIFIRYYINYKDINICIYIYNSGRSNSCIYVRIRLFFISKGYLINILSEQCRDGVSRQNLNHTLTGALGVMMSVCYIVDLRT